MGQMMLDPKYSQFNAGSHPSEDFDNGFVYLIIIAEHAIGVNLADDQVWGERPVRLDLGQVLLSIFSDTDLVTGQMTCQSASGKNKDGLTNMTSMVGVFNNLWFTMSNFVVLHIHTMSLQMQKPKKENIINSMRYHLLLIIATA